MAIEKYYKIKDYYFIKFCIEEKITENNERATLVKSCEVIDLINKKSGDLGNLSKKCNNSRDFCNLILFNFCENEDGASLASLEQFIKNQLELFHDQYNIFTDSVFDNLSTYTSAIRKIFTTKEETFLTKFPKQKEAKLLYKTESNKEDYEQALIKLYIKNEIKTLSSYFRVNEKYYKFDEQYIKRNSDLEIQLEMEKNKICCLTGKPGTGKTTAAINYAYQNRDKYTESYLFNSETVKSFCDSLGIQLEEGVPVEEQFLQKLESLIGDKASILFIFDNVSFDNVLLKNEEKFENKIKRIIQELHNNHKNLDIIFTIRTRRNYICREIEFFNLTKGEARDFLKMNLNCDEKELKCIELIIESTTHLLILSTIRDYRKFENTYQFVKDLNMIDDIKASNGLKTAISQFFLKLNETLEEKEHPFVSILKICSLLYSPSIEYSLLCDIGKKMNIDLENIDKYINRFCFIERDDTVLKLHREYADIIVNSIPKKERDEIVENIICILEEKIKYDDYFSFAQNHEINQNINHIDKLFRFGLYNERMIDIISACWFHFGNNYSTINQTHLNFDHYLSKLKVTKSNRYYKIMYDLNKSYLSFGKNQTTLQIEDEIATLNEILLEISNEGFNKNELYKLLVRGNYIKAILEDKNEGIVQIYEKSLKTYDECIYFCEMGKSNLTDMKNQGVDIYKLTNDYYFYHKFYIMCLTGKGHFYRKHSEFKQAEQLYDLAKTKLLKINGTWRAYLSEMESQMEFPKIFNLNAQGINFIENNIRLEKGLDNIKKCYFVYKNYHMLSAMRNQVMNCAIYFNFKCLNKKENIEEYEKNLYMIQYFLDFAYKLYIKGKDVEFNYTKNKEDINKKEIEYYLQEYLLYFNCINHPLRDTNVYKMNLTNELLEFGIYDDNKFISEIEPFKQYIESNKQKSYVNIFYEAAKQSLGNLLKCICAADVKLDSDIEELKSSRPKLLLLCLRYYAAITRRAGQFTEDHKKRESLYNDALKIINKSIEYGEMLKLHKLLPKVYREKVIVYDIQSNKEEVKETLSSDDMKFCFGLIDPTSSIYKWYEGKCIELGIKLSA